MHRISGQGDYVVRQLYEDLFELGRSQKIIDRVRSGQSVVKTGNRQHGVRARRGDGTFGEAVPGESPLRLQGFVVATGRIATIEIGAEAKILAKSMIKQIDRVTGDLRKQVEHFQNGGGHPICVAVVGVNQAPFCVGYEGDREYDTDGKGNRHPMQEAAEAERRLLELAAPAFDEFVLLKYSATNGEPYPFSWSDVTSTKRDYGASLVRISREYDRRF